MINIFISKSNYVWAKLWYGHGRTCHTASGGPVADLFQLLLLLLGSQLTLEIPPQNTRRIEAIAPTTTRVNILGKLSYADPLYTVPLRNKNTSNACNYILYLYNYQGIHYGMLFMSKMISQLSSCLLYRTSYLLYRTFHLLYRTFHLLYPDSLLILTCCSLLPSSHSDMLLIPTCCSL